MLFVSTKLRAMYIVKHLKTLLLVNTHLNSFNYKPISCARCVSVNQGKEEACFCQVLSPLALLPHNHLDYLTNA